MNSEIQSILDAFEQSQRQGKSAFLATVVKTQGSTYRRPGARLLITEDGQTVGLVSGGCLENDLFEHTHQRMPDRQAIIVTYDHNATDDLLWGFGLGCTGIVEVLLEFLNPPHDPLTFLARCWRDRIPGVLASIIRVDESCAESNAIQLGAYLTLTSDSIGILGNQPDLTDAIIPDAQAVMQDRQSMVKEYAILSQRVQVLIEFIQPPTPLIIFGAGQDAVAIAQFAKALGWHVTVVDCRANSLSHERFALCDQVILTHREQIASLNIPSDAVVTIMTHNYYDDLEILKVLLPSSLRYLGLLGPKQRAQRLLDELQQDTAGSNIQTAEQLLKLYAPVGLDVGADTPAMIALSIIAEIQAVLSDRPGNSLKYRNRSIHETPQDRLTSFGSRGFKANGNAQVFTSHSRN
jgi:xanthine dehydrogenase accessory factor